MIKPGKKTKEWIKAKRKLKREYLVNGITKCEGCKGCWGLSFHHLSKRSSGKSEHTFKETRLLCAICHEKAEYNKDFNERLRRLR